ncbi:MAG: hypothetical protein RLZZ262_780 [Bacteroidota bacterium]|jgi:hypothetical protein
MFSPNLVYDSAISSFFAILAALHIHTMKKIFPFLALVVLLASCTKTETKKYTITDVVITAEGPLFDGPNTMQANHIIDLNQLAPGFKADQIESVKLNKAEIRSTDSLAFNNIRNFVLQLTSADAKMEKVGVLNPVPKNSPLVQILPAAEAEITDNFKQKDMIIILDADLEGDLDGNLSYTGNFEFEITYKK